MELAFNFAKRINNINFVDILLNGTPKHRFILSIALKHLHACNPLVGLYSDCIKRQNSERFSNVVEYLYYSLMYISIIPVAIHKYLADPTENGSIILRIRDLESKYKSIAAFVIRLYSIFEQPKFNRTLRLKLRLEPIYDSIGNNSYSYSAVIKCVDAMHVTMRFNYLNRFVTKLYTDPNTAFKILTYLILLR